MVRSLLINNSCSVEYINRQVSGKSRAFGLYVLAYRTIGNHEFFDLKRKVLMAMLHIDHQMDKKMLAAIYIDLVSEMVTQHLAFKALCADLRSGMFRKILLIDLDEFNQDDFLQTAMNRLVWEMRDLETVDLNGVIFQPTHLHLNLLIGV